MGQLLTVVVIEVVVPQQTTFDEWLATKGNVDMNLQAVGAVS